MIPEAQKEIILTNNLLGENSKFSIESNSHAFTILINKLYTNKIQAVVRELISNAFDSHIAAKKLDTNFDVIVPTRLTPTFKVRDYGIGMTHEEIMNLYISIFASTKTNTNTQQGMFGLGSKSPFSYTNTFSLTSFENHSKNFYIAVIGNDGVPEITHIITSPSTSPVGIEISIPVNPDDIAAFVEEVWYASHVTNIPMNVMGSRIVPIKPIFTHGNFRIFRKNPKLLDRLGHTSFCQGSVIYPLLGDFYIEELVDSIVVFDVPIGTFQVAPSRENIEDDYDIRQNIIDKFIDKFKKEIAFFPESISSKNDLDLYSKTAGLTWLRDGPQKSFIELCPDDLSLNDFISNNTIREFKSGHKDSELLPVSRVFFPSRTMIIVDDDTVSMDTTLSRLRTLRSIPNVISAFECFLLIDLSELENIIGRIGAKPSQIRFLKDLSDDVSKVDAKKASSVKKYVPPLKKTPLPPPLPPPVATLAPGQTWGRKEGKYNIQFDYAMTSDPSLAYFKLTYKKPFLELGLNLDDVAFLSTQEAKDLKAPESNKLENVIKKLAKTFADTNYLQGKLNISETWSEYDSLTSEYSLSQRFHFLCSRGGYLTELPLLVRKYLIKYEPKEADLIFTPTEYIAIRLLDMKGTSLLNSQIIQEELKSLTKAFSLLSPDGDLINELFTFYIENIKT